MSGSEAYKLECSTCGHVVTVPAVDGDRGCPNCGAVLHLAWHAERTAFSRQREEQQREQ